MDVKSAGKVKRGSEEGLTILEWQHGIMHHGPDPRDNRFESRNQIEKILHPSTFEDTPVPAHASPVTLLPSLPVTIFELIGHGCEIRSRSADLEEE